MAAGVLERIGFWEAGLLEAFDAGLAFRGLMSDAMSRRESVRSSISTLA
jgi:arginine/ornithine N-succinyltransferase beta subunit